MGRSNSRTTRAGVTRLALAVAVGLALGGVVGIIILIASRDDAPAPRDASDTGVAHVHGLGVNPVDGSLIVATHYGSFRLAVDQDEVTRIGASYQDTMGFTVAGPDHFLGSGHPDLAGRRAGQPTQLGLIESTDGGETWTALSLSGDADFHGLAVAHDQVYGWDASSGRFMVSTDRRNWETRATLELFGFAVDPTDADHLIAAGPDGLIETSDGGRRWNPVDGPQLVTVSWHADAGLWGADPSGVVWQHSDEGWQRAGNLPGEPQTLLATADAMYAAAHVDDTTGIYQSTDSGQTWDLRYRDNDQ